MSVVVVMKLEDLVIVNNVALSLPCDSLDHRLSAWSAVDVLLQWQWFCAEFYVVLKLL